MAGAGRVFLKNYGQYDRKGYGYGKAAGYGSYGYNAGYYGGTGYYGAGLGYHGAGYAPHSPARYANKDGHATRAAYK